MTSAFWSNKIYFILCICRIRWQGAFSQNHYNNLRDFAWFIFNFFFQQKNNMITPRYLFGIIDTLYIYYITYCENYLYIYINKYIMHLLSLFIVEFCFFSLFLSIVIFHKLNTKSLDDNSLQQIFNKEIFLEEIYKKNISLPNNRTEKIFIY